MASKPKQSKELKQVKSKSEWRQCNHCGVIVYFKDEQNHFEECDIIRLKNSYRGTCISPLTGLSSSSLPENLKHCYVANGVLHAKVSDPDDEGLDWGCVPKIRNLILMHPSTMRLCRIPAMGYVTVAGGGYVSVHVAWRNDSLDRRSVAFCPLKMSLHFHPSSMVTVQNYSRLVQEADEITVVCTDREQEEVIQNEDFSLYVNAQFYQEVVAVGMTVTCKYWGTRIKVTVTSISAKQVTADDFEMQSMSDQIGNLSVQSTVYTLDSINKSVDDSVCDLTTESSFDTSKLLSSSSSISCSTPTSSIKASSHSSTPYNKNFRTFSSFQEDPSECDQADYFKVTSLTVITVQKVESDPPVKKITFNDIGGLSQQLHTINRITEELFSPSNIGRMGAKMYEGMLLYGPSGTGKTFVAEAIGNECALPFISVTANEVIVRHFGSEDKEVQKRFEEAIARAPSVLFLDAIDKLLSSGQDTTNQRKRKVLAVLINMFDKLKGNLKNPVLIIATAQELSSVHYRLRADDRFSVEIEFKVPTPLERYEILEKLMENEPHSLTKEELSEIPDRTHAYTGSDLTVLWCAAKRLAIIRNMRDGIKDAKELAKRVTINFADVTNAMKKVTPFSMMIQEVKTEKVSWDDTCGLYEMKSRLQDAVEWPLKYPDVFSRYNINPTSGILMHGTTGCSKTTLAKALATESGLNFIAIKGPELFTKCYGEYERAIKELFARARASKPCIIFLDEVDALLIGQESSSDGSGVGRGLVCQFLSEFGGIGACDGIIVIAATDRPDILNDAALRPGRIGELVEIPLPDAETRKEILQKKLKEMPVSDDIDFELLVEKTKGFSGAQVVASCKEAHWLLIDETFPESGKITMSMLQEIFKSSKITMSMLLQAIETIRKPEATNIDDYD